MLVLTLSATAQPQARFAHLTTEDGLCQNDIFAVLQDHRGMNLFDPAALCGDPTPPLVAIIGFEVAARPVRPGTAVEG